MSSLGCLLDRSSIDWPIAVGPLAQGFFFFLSALLCFALRSTVRILTGGERRGRKYNRDNFFWGGSGSTGFRLFSLFFFFFFPAQENLAGDASTNTNTIKSQEELDLTCCSFCLCGLACRRRKKKQNKQKTKKSLGLCALLWLLAVLQPFL